MVHDALCDHSLWLAPVDEAPDPSLTHRHMEGPQEEVVAHCY